jgi:class 3 adenylate cyclase
MDIVTWLRDLGLEQYEVAFRENAIDLKVLPELTDADLRSLGVLLGHRKQMLKAIAANGSDIPRLTVAEPSQVLISAERRQLTVLFCDLAESTALSARLDLEDLREAIVVYHGCIAEAVRHHGGYVARYMGDGLLAYFGWPEANEDDAERAVRAGLAAVQAVAGLEVMLAGPLAARVGIATGPVIVGDVVGEGLAQERGVFGETPNLAARLQNLAEPGAVVVCSTTRRLTGALFTWGDLGDVALKGMRALVRAFRALDEGTIESRFEALRRGAGRSDTAAIPLVGRSREFQTLLNDWTYMARGKGRVVLLGGEAGIGKSRLTMALREALGEQPHEQLEWFCSPRHKDSPLYPVISHLTRNAGFARGDTAETRTAKIEALLTPLSPLLKETVELFAGSLGVPLGGYSMPDLSPQRQRGRMLEALFRHFEALAKSGSLFAVVEDAHWADPSTLELLELVVARIAALPALLIVTHRPEFQPPWRGQSHVTRLQLDRLGARDTAALIKHVAGSIPLSAELYEQITDKAEGVPLFVEELTKATLESSLLREAVENPLVNRPLLPLAVPSTLQASLLARLDRLATAREVAQIGAVIGREFYFDLLMAVAPLTETALVDALARLTEAELIFPYGATLRTGYAFKHTMIRDVAYSTLLRDRRQQLHAKIAEMLRQHFPEQVDSAPELLAQHYTLAGLIEPAVRHWLAAGQRAFRASAHQEAVSHLRKGTELLERLPQGALRARLTVDLRANLGLVRSAAKGYSHTFQSVFDAWHGKSR